MKVLNYTTTYFSIALLIIISIWAALFYYAMLDEIYDSIDDGLDNQKGLIIQKSATDPTILTKNTFQEGDYSIREIPAQLSKNFHDVYIDTLMYMQNEKEFEPVRLLKTVFHQNGKYYHMEVITSMVEEDDLISELALALLWLYLGLLATILLLNNFLLKRIWRPFYHLLKQLKIFRLENPSTLTIQKTNIDEFRLLNETVQRLLQTNINSYNSQKHFIENASHELQTPLAISINKLEALAETGTLSQNQLELLSSALDNLERLTRLNKSLLLLSKIENRQFLEETQVEVNAMIQQIASDFSDQISFSSLDLGIENVEACSIRMNPDLASIMFTNLIKNAIVHNHPGGEIKIRITNNAVRFENTGPGQALDQEKLFTRFHNEQSTSGSTGLGLAIVKAIADLYAFSIHYSFMDRHIITISFR